MDPVKVKLREFLGDKKYVTCPHCAAINVTEEHAVDGYVFVIKCSNCATNLQVEDNTQEG